MSDSASIFIAVVRRNGRELVSERSKVFGSHVRAVGKRRIRSLRRTNETQGHAKTHVTVTAIGYVPVTVCGTA